MKKTLSDLKPHETAIVSEIQGGQGLVSRLNALGIRRGKKITMIHPVFSRGPVTVLVDRTHIAIGRGMADKILVTAEEP
ncbi:MAG: ferrous iron transport protein A [Syntrophales bacterium]|jgi:ferrous iron transport protein A|nr:ferrous iron transport protein A [Syntrophales bacterium]MCK9527309.1 ferrous iron transport protein A [Syntrophales bacterium]MDX9921221.1 FeoA family protein [Syntrophales bacterium]